MIVQSPGMTWNAQCDGCCAVIDTGLTSFQQAVNYISRAEGWHNRRLRGVWNNFSPIEIRSRIHLTLPPGEIWQRLQWHSVALEFQRWQLRHGIYNHTRCVDEIMRWLRRVT
jgi:hypothetical protein